MDDFSPRSSLDRILRYWWLIALFCISGGGLAWLINDAQPPLYEAQARFHLSLDMVRTGEIERLDIDVATQTAGWVMSDPGVLEQVIAQASAQEIQVDREKMREIFTPEQYGEKWLLRVRYPDPQAAATLANIWAEVGESSLSNALRHAEQAESYRHYLETMETCLAQAYLTRPATAQCAADNIQAIQNDLAVTGELYLQEKNAARGVSPAINFNLETLASVPTTPARHQRSTMILAGAAIGLLLGGWAVSAGLIDGLRKIKRVG